MADFEVLPVGTREAMQDARDDLRMIAKALDDADDAWRFSNQVEALEANGSRLEALLEQQVERGYWRPAIIEQQGGQSNWEIDSSRPVVMDQSGNGRHLRWADEVQVRGEPRSVEEFDLDCPTCQGLGVYDSKPIPPDTGPAMEFECYACDGTGRRKPPQDFRASVLELTPSMALRQSGPEEVVRLREALNEAEDFMRSMLSGDVGSEWNIGVNALLETFRAVRRPSSEGKKEEG